jgi:hypothetical protein
MKPRVYVETTVISYLAASPSRNVVVAAHQELTHEWWERRDRTVAARRLAHLADIPLLDLSDHVNEFARRLLSE